MSVILAIIGSGLLLVLVHALPWMGAGRPPFIRSPAKMAALLSGLHVIPHFVVVSILPERSIIYPMYGDSLRELLPRFGALYACGFAAFLFGIRCALRSGVAVRNMSISYQPKYYAIALGLAVLYFASTAAMIMNGGGLDVYMRNYGTQVEFQYGTGIFQIIKIPAAYLSILFLAVHNARTGRPRAIWIALYIGLIVLVEAGLGGRRAPMQLILFSGIAVYMVNPRRRIVSVQNIIIGSSCALIFVILMILRDRAYDYRGYRDFLSYVTNFSYNDTYMFVLDYFSKNEKWYGKVFLDFQYRFFGWDKGIRVPSLDEGIYIYNLYLGRPAYPPMSPQVMAQNSWPPRTFGNGYMNFGFLGVVVFFFIQGIVTSISYKNVVRSNFYPAFIFLYLIVVFSFQISNLKITEMLIICTGLCVIFGPAWLAGRVAFRRVGAR